MKRFTRTTTFASLAAAALLATTSSGHSMGNDTSSTTMDAQMQTMATTSAPVASSEIYTDPQTHVVTSKVTTSNGNMVRDSYVISSELRPTPGDPENYATLDRILPSENRVATSSSVIAQSAQPQQATTVTTTRIQNMPVMTAENGEEFDPNAIEPAAGGEGNMLSGVDAQPRSAPYMNETQAELAVDGQIVPSVRQGELSPELNVDM